MITTKPKISIVILDFLKSKRVVESVAAIERQQTDFSVEIIVADNSCNPENAAKLRELESYENVKLIFNEKNLGYTRGCNAGARQATGEYLLILNPDIVMREPDSLQKLLDFMERNPQIGMVGPRQIDEPTGETAMTVRAFPKLILQIARRTFLRHLPILKTAVEHDEMRHLDYGVTQPVDWLQSSFVLIRRDLWEAVGGFDEHYFLFMSDPEMCWQAWLRGAEVIYYPEVVVYADGLRASAGGFADFFARWTMQQHLRDAIKYRLRHFGRRNPRKALMQTRTIGEYK